MSEIKVRTYFSITHIRSASHLAKKSLEAESRFNGDLSSTDHQDFVMNLAYVTGTIFAAVSFLEAIINELFSDSYEYFSEPGAHDNIKHLGSDIIRSMSTLWAHGVPRTARYPIIEKYDILMNLIGKK